jgi:hypothetical protein
MTHPAAKHSAAKAAADSPVRDHAGTGHEPVPDTLVRTKSGAFSSRFLAQLATHTDGIGWVQVLESWRRHGVLARLTRAGAAGVTLGPLAEELGMNLGYLAVVCRVLAAHGWLWRETAESAVVCRVGLSPAGAELLPLLEAGMPSSLVSAFVPVLRHMAAYLEGAYEPPPAAPSLEQLSRWSARGWGLPPGENELQRRVVQQLAAALDGNLLGPVAVALSLGGNPAFGWAQAPGRKTNLGQPPEREAAPANARQRAAFEVLVNAGWASWQGERISVTDYGVYALRRAPAYGVPVSYLPLFENIDALLFGNAEQFWQRGAGQSEQHVDRALNVRASGASHARYFAAADQIVTRAFDQPWPEQPIGVCDMGSGDGAWLEHVWKLITERTERGRLMRAHPHDSRYRLLLVGVDYNEAARKATRQRLASAGIPHLVLFGDINDPGKLRADLARRGIDSKQLLHSSSFLVHNRPFTGVRDTAAAARHPASGSGAYAWRGRALGEAELQQNLVEFLTGWRAAIGHHGMVVIELHDPERVTPGKTLTSYMLTHGLSDQLTVPLAHFEAAALAAGLDIDPAEQRLFPEDRAAATISVSHLRSR